VVGRFSTIFRKCREGLIGAAALVLFFGIAGTSALDAAPRQHVVEMRGMSFGAIPTDVKVGDTIVWKNDDTVIHSVTARDKSFDLRILPRKSATMTVTKAGTFPIYCAFHPPMRGTLKVAQ
jgi:plastocyanin